LRVCITAGLGIGFDKAQRATGELQRPITFDKGFPGRREWSVGGKIVEGYFQLNILSSSNDKWFTR
jgi:hypothetical protein